MKGTLTLQNDTVHIEEFSYPLEEFLMDEPDFKALKNAEIIYHRGQGTTVIVDGKHREADQDYPSETIEVYIGRKSMYRSAHKARRSAIKPSKIKRAQKKTTKASVDKPTATKKEEKQQTTQTNKPVTEEKRDADH